MNTVLPIHSWLNPVFTRHAWGVAVLAAAVRTAYLLDSRDNPSFETPVIDAAHYYSLARELAAASDPGAELF